MVEHITRDGLENIYNTTVMGDFRFGVDVNLVSSGIQCQTLTPWQNIIHYPWQFLVVNSNLSKDLEEQNSLSKNSSESRKEHHTVITTPISYLSKKSRSENKNRQREK